MRTCASGLLAGLPSGADRRPARAVSLECSDRACSGSYFSIMTSPAGPLVQRAELNARVLVDPGDRRLEGRDQRKRSCTAHCCTVNPQPVPVSRKSRTRCGSRSAAARRCRRGDAPVRGVVRGAGPGGLRPAGNQPDRDVQPARPAAPARPMACQNSCRAPDLVLYPRRSRSFASSTCS